MLFRSAPQNTILFSSVRFMAETAKIVSPHKTVLHPSPEAGCSLSDSITAQDVRDIRAKYPGDEEKVRRMSIIEGGQVKMAHLSIYGSNRVNGVAELHSKIIKEQMFQDFSEMYPDRFINVTNGVTQRRWLLYCNPLLAEFITKKIGPKWITDFTHIQELKKFAEDKDSLEELLEIKKKNKKRLAEFLREKNPIRDSAGRVQHFTDPLGEDALYDLQVKRIHEYKRQLMNILHVLMLYFEIKQDPSKKRVKRQVIFAGKAAAGYEAAKHIIQLICCVSRKVNNDPDVNSTLRVQIGRAHV